MSLKIDVISTFPGIVETFAEMGIVGRAFKLGLAKLKVWNLRDFADDRFKHIDDDPYGGGPGMVIKPDPIFRTFDALEAMNSNEPRHVIFLTPQGKPFQQDDAERLSQQNHLVFLCGRYKGIDERVREALVDEEFSIGDYVLSGGELAAFVMIDAIVRLLPDATSDGNSVISDTFPFGLLDAPLYTRPAEYRGMQVPEILLSGNHAEIEKWRLEQRLERTRQRRKDLYKQYMRRLEDRENEQGQ